MGRALLITTAGLMFIFGMVQFNITQRQKSVPIRSANYYADQQARNLATSMVNLAIEEIRDNKEWLGEFSFPDYMGGTGFVKAYDALSANKPDSTNTGIWDEFKILLYSEMEYEGAYVETEVLVQRDGFSRFSYFTDREGDGIYFFSGDEISGPVHTNGTMNIAGEPVFTGMVSSPNMWRGRSGDHNDPQFLGGSNFGADHKEPPDTEQLNRIKKAVSPNLSFENPIEVIFNENGSVTITENLGRSNSWPYNFEYETDTFDLNHYNGVISSTREVSTKGTINGQVTLHSEKDITIIGDLIYNTDPRTDSTSTDLLGLVSEKNVVVDKDAHRDNGNKDLTIHATLMALEESFYVENWQESCCSRGKIELLGGIVQIERGAVGTFSGNSVRSGFSKSYEYDERLLNIIPPFYPREKWFSIVYWRDRTY